MEIVYAAVFTLEKIFCFLKFKFVFIHNFWLINDVELGMKVVIKLCVCLHGARLPLLLLLVVLCY